MFTDGAVANMCEELAWEISKCSEGTGRPAAPNDSEAMAMQTEVSTTNQPPSTNKRVQRLVARIRAKVRKSSRSSSIDQTALQCRYREDCGEGTVLYDA